MTNWHRFAPESEHSENGKSYAVVNKGPETPDTFARRVLEDLYDRLPIMVMNDEGHHCWRPAPADEELTSEERKALEEEALEARVWLDGLDRINNCTANPAAKPGISICLDLSATPFYLKGSGYPEGRPFPWIVSDFGLVDAIESGIVKIPRLPVLDTTGRPDPKYFKLWKAINENLEPGERLPGKSKRPKPEVVYREAEGALLQIASQWKERFLADGGGDAGAGARTAGAHPGLRQHRHRRGLLPEDQRGNGDGDGHRGGRGRGARRGRSGKRKRRRRARSIETETGEGRQAQDDHGVRQGSDLPRALLEHARREPDDPDRYQAAGRGRERRSEERRGRTPPRNCARWWQPWASRGSRASMCAAWCRSPC